MGRCLNGGIGGWMTTVVEADESDVDDVRLGIRFARGVVY